MKLLVTRLGEATVEIEGEDDQRPDILSGHDSNEQGAIEDLRERLE